MRCIVGKCDKGIIMCCKECSVVKHCTLKCKRVTKKCNLGRETK